jgi:hypothetical protein
VHRVGPRRIDAQGPESSPQWLYGQPLFFVFHPSKLAIGGIYSTVSVHLGDQRTKSLRLEFGRFDDGLYFRETAAEYACKAILFGLG